MVKKPQKTFYNLNNQNLKQHPTKIIDLRRHRPPPTSTIAHRRRPPFDLPSISIVELTLPSLSLHSCRRPSPSNRELRSIAVSPSLSRRRQPSICKKTASNTTKVRSLVLLQNEKNSFFFNIVFFQICVVKYVFDFVICFWVDCSWN